MTTRRDLRARLTCELALVTLSARSVRSRPARSVLTALSVGVATTGLTVFLSLGAGVRQAVREQVDSIRPQLQVSAGGVLQSLAPAPTLPEEIVAQAERQRAALGLRFVTPVILSRQTLGGLDATLYGIPAAAGLGRVYPYARVARGRALRADDEGEAVAVLGAQVARNLAVDVGADVTLGGGTRVRVIGVLAGTRSLTDAFVVLPLRTAQRALRVPGLVSLAAVEVPEDADVPRVAAALARRVDAEVHTQLTARQVARRLLGVMDVAQWALSGVALVVAYLSVLTTMTMAGHERRAELGTLRALGARPGQVARLLALDAVLLSALGGTLGVLGGVGLAAAVSAVTQTRLGVRALIVTPEVGLTALGVGVLVGVLAALPVAWRVRRESVSDALRSV